MNSETESSPCICRVTKYERTHNPACPVHRDRHAPVEREFDQLARFNNNSLVDPESAMETTLNVVSALAQVDDWIENHHEDEGMHPSIYGAQLLLKAAMAAAQYVNVQLDLQKMREATL